MINLREVYRRAEENRKFFIYGLIATLVILISLQYFLSPILVLFLILATVFLVVSVYKPLWTLAFLAVYLPFEPFALKFMPDEVYIYAKFFSEVLIYILVVITIWRVLSGEAKVRQSPIDLPFILFLIVLLASALINAVPVSVALLGIRQIIRFILIFFIVYYLAPSHEYIKKITWVMFSIVIIQCLIALAQSFIGGPLDALLLPAEARIYGDITITSGVVQFWDPGSRVFATLGRYDRLGNFMYIFLLLGVGILYETRLSKNRKELWWMLVLALPTLVLTYSRSSWFAFLLGFLFIGLILKRDRRVLITFLSFIIVIGLYLTLSGLQVRYISEAPGQTLVERFFETFSYTRWKGGYYGLGRIYWMVQTPLVVVPSAPLFGVGPGLYGGGAVAALRDSRAYEALGLPFGVYGSEGFIDNNWFSLWGETGTLGFVFYLWMYTALFFYAVRIYRHSRNASEKALAAGFAAMLIAIGFNAALSTLFEIRTTAFYLWLYAGFIAVIGERSKQRALIEGKQ